MGSNPIDQLHHSIAICILAAGASKRMGVPKQMLPWKNTTLLGHTIAQAQKITNHIIVVLGANIEAIGKTIPQNITAIINASWKKGMGTSINLGVRQIENRNDIDSLLIMTVDQPLIDYGHLSSMLKKHQEKQDHIIATAYEGRNGVPAIFPRTGFDGLMELNEDYGARKLLRNNDKVLSILAEDRAIDVDTLEDYQKLYDLYGKH